MANQWNRHDPLAIQIINSNRCYQSESDSSQHLSPGVLDSRIAFSDTQIEILHPYFTDGRKKSKGSEVNDYCHGLKSQGSLSELMERNKGGSRAEVLS